MPLNETDTRAKPIDPALHRRDWPVDMIRRELAAGEIEAIGGQTRRRDHEKTGKERRASSRMMFEDNYREEFERLAQN